MSSASLAGVRLTASRVRTQARWDPLRPRARGRAKRLRKRRAHGPQQMVCQASERPRKFSKQLQSQGRRGKGTWDHSGLVPNETFRYQVKVLALSKAQTKVLPLPCPLLIPRRGTGSSSRGSSKPRTPSLGGYRQLPSCWASPWCQRQRPEPSDHLEGSWSQQKVFPCVGKGWASHPERNPSSVQDK